MAQVVNAMLDRLNAAFTTQRTFIAQATRELETPVARVDAALARAREPDDPAVLAARREVGRMAGLLADLDVLAEAERPEFVRPRPTDVDALLEELLAREQGSVRRRWQLAERSGTTAELDPDRVRQALTRLLENAVEHTRDGDVITLGATRREDRVRIHVADQGPGVDAEEVEVIFERFQRGVRPDGDPQTPDGAGLGLAVVRAVADAHEGSAWVESVPGQGSTFGLDLPLRSPLTRPAELVGPAGAVADDDLERQDPAR